MKIKDDIDLNTIVTTIVFIVAMIVWGIRLEGKVSSNTSTMEAHEQAQEKMQKLRWDAIDSRMDRLRADVTLIEQQLREITP